MHITKVIETGLDIANCIDICADLEPSVMKILANNFVNRCFRGCYITKINRIIKIGECRINQDGEPSFGSVSVMFEVSAIVLVPGEILHGCLVVNQAKNGTLICANPIADIMVARMPEFASVTAGQIIPIRVHMVRYDPHAPKIAISGVHYLPAVKYILYRVSSPLRPTELHAHVLGRIDAEEAKAAELRKGKAWAVFSQLVSPFKTEKKLPAGAEAVDLMKVPAGASLVSRDPRVDLLKPTIVSYASESVMAHIPPDDTLSADQVLLLFLEDYCASLKNVRDMVETYNTEDLIKKHANLWKIYKKFKAD